MNVRRNPLITALILILAGGVIFVFALSTVGFDFERLGNTDMKEYTVIPDESFSSVSADLNDCDLILKLSENGKVSVKIFSPEDTPVEVTVENDVLKLFYAGKEISYTNLFTFNRKGPYVILCLPEDLKLDLTAALTSGDVDSTVVNRFGCVNVGTVSGDIIWNGATSADRIDFSSTNGDIMIARTGLSGDSGVLSVSSISGDIDVYECRADAEVRISTENGDIRFTGCETDGTITIETTSGEIRLSETNADTLSCLSTSGDTYVEDSKFRSDVQLSSVSGEMMLGDLVTEGACTIRTTNGDVHFVRSGASRFDIGTVSGDVTGSLLGMEEEFRGDGSHTSSPGASVEWKVETTSGYVHLFPEE